MLQWSTPGPATANVPKLPRAWPGVLLPGVPRPLAPVSVPRRGIRGTPWTLPNRGAERQVAPALLSNLGAV